MVVIFSVWVVGVGITDGTADWVIADPELVEGPEAFVDAGAEVGRILGTIVGETVGTVDGTFDGVGVAAESDAPKTAILFIALAIGFVAGPKAAIDCP